MNEETNNFSIDIEAEKSNLFLPEETDQDLQPLINILPNLELPETVPYAVTEMDMSQKIQPAITETLVTPDVKISAEEAYEKAESTSRSLNEIKNGLNDLAGAIQSPWLENKNKDDFEERPLTEPQNLIFEARRNRMTEFPHWA
jgi:hypothetical protein